MFCRGPLRRLMSLTSTMSNVFIGVKRLGGVWVYDTSHWTTRRVVLHLGERGGGRGLRPDRSTERYCLSYVIYTKNTGKIRTRSSSEHMKTTERTPTPEVVHLFSPIGWLSILCCILSFLNRINRFDSGISTLSLVGCSRFWRLGTHSS